MPAGRFATRFTKGAVEPLIQVFQQDEFWGVRAEAAHALAALRDPRAVEPLLKAVAPGASPVPGYAIDALRAFAEPA